MKNKQTHEYKEKGVRYMRCQAGCCYVRVGDNVKNVSTKATCIGSKLCNWIKCFLKKVNHNELKQVVLLDGIGWLSLWTKMEMFSQR